MGAPHSLEELPRLSLELLCESEHAVLLEFAQFADVPANLKVGDVIDVYYFCRAYCGNQATPQTYDDVGMLPLEMIHRTSSGEPHFRVAQQVIEVDFLGEALSVAWGLLDLNGSMLWTYEPWPGDFWWNLYCEGGRRDAVRMRFQSGSMRPLHPELAPQFI